MREGRGRGLTKAHLSELQTLGLGSVGRGKRRGQSANGGSVVEGGNCITEVGDAKMVSDLATEDIAMDEEHDAKMETNAAEEHNEREEVEALEEGGESSRAPMEVF